MPDEQGKSDGVAQAVNVKSTKQEIYDAYRALLKQFRSQAATSEEPKLRKEREVELRTLEEVAQLRVGSNVATAIGQARDAVNRTLDAVEREMEERSRTSSKLQEAIRIQEARLKEWYDVERAAQDFLALLRAREEQERAYTVEDTQRKEQRKRDEEQYRYDLEQRKRRDGEEMRAKREEFEAALRTREDALAKREGETAAHAEEFARLAAQVAAFPEQLAQSREATRAETEARMAKDAETELRIARKEAEAQRAVAQSKSDALEQTIERQREQLRDLQQQLQSALAQVQEVTLKTIEGSADRRAFQAVQTFAANQQRPQGNDTRYRNPTAQ